MIYQGISVAKMCQNIWSGTYLPRYVESVADCPVVGTLASTGLGCILLVDDEPALTRVMGGALIQLGYQVIAHNDPEVALADFEAQPEDFDLVIMDQSMPRLSGVELAQQLRRIRPNVPIILCSGVSYTVSEVKSWEARFDAFCMKPLRVQELFEIIQQVFLQRQRAEAE